jgi:hypothetical protein
VSTLVLLAMFLAIAWGMTGVTAIYEAAKRDPE